MTPLLYFAGIGSRGVPDNIFKLMQDISEYLGSLGYVLRSGKAIGSDTAFEIPYDLNGYRKEIWLPWIGFNKHKGVGYYPNENHFKQGPKIHPLWEKLPRYMKFLHARNVGQILGTDLNTPVEFVVCWTPDGCESHETRTKVTGGTGTAITVASFNNIPVFNLKNEDAVERLMYFLKTNLHYPSRFNSFYDDELRPRLPSQMVYVFGSNLAGRHGKGAALEAKLHYGAKTGIGIGLQGLSYGIPTKDEHLNILPIRDIVPHIQEFVEFTHSGDHRFYLTPVGCGLAGYEAKDIAPFFKGIQYSSLPLSWYEYLI